MKYIIWSYKIGAYINNGLLVKEFDTEGDAEAYADSEARHDVDLGLEHNIIDARENGYCIEEIP